MSGGGSGRLDSASAGCSDVCVCVCREQIGQCRRRLQRGLPERHGLGQPVLPSRSRDGHSAAPPSTFSRCINSDGEGGAAK